MAIIFADSFDHYASANLALKGYSSATNAVVSVGNGRFGTDSIRITQSGDLWLPVASVATLMVGYGYRCSSLPGAGQEGLITSFLDTGTGHVELYLTDTGLLRAKRAGTTLATGTMPLLAATFYYIEMKAFINDSTGTFLVRLNGVNEINLSGVDTRNGVNASANQIRLSTINFPSGATGDFDDFVVLDTAGSAPQNDVIGDVRVQARFPNGNGNSSQFDGSDGNQTDNYLLVDEADPNDDTDYVESSDVGDKDTYLYEDLTPTTGTVYGVQCNPWARKTDAGVRTIVSVARFSGTEEDSANKTLASTYAYLRDIRQTKPGGGAWSISDFNSTEFGQKVIA